MGLLAKILDIAADDDFTLARDLLALAMADGKVTEEEQCAIARLCGTECISLEELYDTLSLTPHTMMMPNSRKEKEDYLIKMIQLMGADGESATEEIFLIEIIASKMGFSRYQLTSVVLLNTTRKIFPGDIGTKVLTSFLRNQIDPKGCDSKQNHDNIAKLLNAIVDMKSLDEGFENDANDIVDTLNKVLCLFLDNRIIVDEYLGAGLDLEKILRIECKQVLNKLTEHNNIKFIEKHGTR